MIKSHENDSWLGWIEQSVVQVKFKQGYDDYNYF